MKSSFIFGFVCFLTLSVCGHTQTEKKKSVLGTWHLEITVPPAPMATNDVTFSGSEDGGEFVDKNEHKGNWKLEGYKITWTYTTVPDLKNTFSGTLNDDFTKMEGNNEGVWQGQAFKGTWQGVRPKSKVSRATG